MKIGRLERQALRDIWPREDADFTPWLATPENLELLADTLGLGVLDQVEQEVLVGSFSADIVCRDQADQIVIIENQIEQSDHTHLGQVLTYLAGTKARTIVWIAKRLRDEHRAALDWLNENTTPDFAFFGVELEVWKIGESDPAPKFEVVCRPNNWVKAQKQRAKAAPMEDYQRRMEYWDAFLAGWDAVEGLSPPPTGPNQGWMKLSFVGGNTIEGAWPGIYLYRNLARGLVGVYLSIGKHDADTFLDWKEALVGFPSLSKGIWEINQRGLCQCFITLAADAMNADDWLRQHHWMRDQIHSLLDDWQSGLRDKVQELMNRAEETGPI